MPVGERHNRLNKATLTESCMDVSVKAVTLPKTKKITEKMLKRYGHVKRRKGRMTRAKKNGRRTRTRKETENKTENQMKNSCKIDIESV